LSYDAPMPTQPGQITLEIVVAGIGTGRPLPPLKLPNPQVEAKSLHLYTHAAGIWQEWSRQEDLDASARVDFHYVLEPSRGTITFGDGEEGRVPANGEAIGASYCWTGAAAGLLRANVVTEPARTPRNEGLRQLWRA